MPASSFLLATWDGGGHAAPMLSVAAALTRRGHDVRVLADPIFHDDVLAAGAEPVAWTRAPHTRPGQVAPVEQIENQHTNPKRQFEAVRDTLICGPAIDFAADTAEELDRRPADVVVADHMLPGVLIAAEARGVPRVALAMTFLAIPEWGVPAFGKGLRPDKALHRLVARPFNHLTMKLWAAGLPAINRARAAHGLDPVHEVVDVFARHDRALIASSRALEFDTYDPPAQVRFVGPRLDDPAWAEAWTAPAGDAPLVLGSLSSSRMTQQATLKTIASALGSLPVRGVVTTGPHVDPATITSAAHVDVRRAAPHAAILSHAAAAISHGGHGTVMKALAAGVPLVLMPLGRDQHDVAARVVSRGAGVVVKADASPHTLAGALRHVLRDPSYRVAAAALADAIAADVHPDRAVVELEALAESARVTLPA